MIDCYLVELGYWVNYDNKYFKRYIYTPDNLYKSLLKYRYGNRGVFKTAYSYDTKDIENAYLLGDFYLDFDDDKNFENVREDVITSISLLTKIFRIKNNDIDIYFSGNKGVHLIIDKKILGIKPNKRLNHIFKFIMEEIKNQTKNKTIDSVIYDNKRLFRIVNSQHEKTNLFKIPITYEELVNYPLDRIKQLATKPRSINQHEKVFNEVANKMYLLYAEKAEIDYLKKVNTEYFSNIEKQIRDVPPCIQNLLDEGPIEGNRNNTLATLVSFYKTKGLSYQETKKELTLWNNGAISDGEFERTCKSIYTKKFRYGCSTLKKISICDYNSCPLMKARRRKEGAV